MKKYMAVAGTAFFYTVFYFISHRDQMQSGLIFLIVFFLFCLLNLCAILLARYVKKSRIINKLAAWNEKINETVDELFPRGELFLHFWILLTLFYLPAYLAWFPGIFGYDTPVQAALLFGKAVLTQHHPLLHTWLLGTVLKAGELLHDYNAAFAIYTALQMLVVTGSLAYSFVFMKKRKVPFLLILLGFLWTIINPFLQTLTFNATKDTLFGAFMLLFTVSFWEIAEPVYPVQKIAFVKVLLFGCLMCLFRNQGIYMVIALTFICLLCRLKDRKLYACMMGIVAVYVIFCVICTNILKIPQGDKREMLSVPMQQVAAAAYHYLEYGEETVTEEQLRTVEEVIPEEFILKWYALSADPVKSGFKTAELEKNFFRHFKNYFQIGLQNPDIYVSAFYFMIFPYWDMSYNEFRELLYSYTFPEHNEWGIEGNSIFRSYQIFLTDRIDAESIPFWTQPAPILWCMVALTGIAIGRRKKYLFIGGVTPILYFGTVLLGPQALLRYAYPLLLTMPLIFCMTLRALSDSKQA